MKGTHPPAAACHPLTTLFLLLRHFFVTLFSLSCCLSVFLFFNPFLLLSGSPLSRFQDDLSSAVWSTPIFDRSVAIGYG